MSRDFVWTKKYTFPYKTVLLLERNVQDACIFKKLFQKATVFLFTTGECVEFMQLLLRLTTDEEDEDVF